MPNRDQTIIRASRVILTCLILFLLTWYFQLPERVWSLITVCFVMLEYTTFGGVLSKSFMRFFGTLIAAVYGLVIIYICKNNVLINMFALIPGVFFYMYYFLNKEDTYIAVIGTVTLVIVLLNHNDIDAAILRTTNIIIGILAALFMMRFFYPQYARDDVIINQSNFIEQLSCILENYLNESKPLTLMKRDCVFNEQNFIMNIASFTTHLNESKVETAKTPLFVTYNLTALEHIRHLFRIFSVFINYVTTEEIRSDAWVRQNVVEILASLNDMKHRLQNNDTTTTKEPLPLNLNKNFSININNKQNTAIIEDIFSNIKNEIMSLDTVVRKIIVLYTRYIIK